MFEKTCILFFSRSAREELKVKSLARNEQQNFRLIKKLQKHTLHTIKRSKIDFQVFDERSQVGNSFAERLTFATDQLFQTYENVIIIGNDCPFLHFQDLRKAAKSLSNGENVLGADHNGGAYLIGIRKDSWEQQSFLQLPWQTDTLFKALKNSFFGDENYVFLRTKTDLNSQVDILKIQGLLFLSGFVKSIVEEGFRVVSSFEIKNPTSQFIFSNAPFRGPPATIS